jgi:hypothetical protein
MKQLLTMAAVCLIAVPAIGGEVSHQTLSQLGLGDLQAVSDAQGMQVRGKSSNAVTSGTSLVFGQLIADLPTGTSFIVVSDVNHAFDTAHNHGLNAYSLAGHQHGSAADAALLILTNPGFDGQLAGAAGQAASQFGGIGKAFGQ